MNPYLLQMIANDRAESMRTVAATARLVRQARRARHASPRHASHMLHAIPQPREAQESTARRAA
jgi:hypothetical protein